MLRNRRRGRKSGTCLRFLSDCRARYNLVRSGINNHTNVGNAPVRKENDKTTFRGDEPKQSRDDVRIVPRTLAVPG